MNKEENKCFYCMRPANPEDKVSVRLESSTGDGQEEHLLCRLHLSEHRMLRKKNAGIKL